MDLYFKKTHSLYPVKQQWERRSFYLPRGKNQPSASCRMFILARPFKQPNQLASFSAAHSFLCFVSFLASLDSQATLLETATWRKPPQCFCGGKTVWEPRHLQLVRSQKIILATAQRKVNLRSSQISKGTLPRVESWDLSEKGSANNVLRCSKVSFEMPR